MLFGVLPSPLKFSENNPYYNPNFSSPLSSPPLGHSPLSPRNGNVPSRQPQVMSSPSLPEKRNTINFSKRAIKPNPLLHSQDGGRETRRKLFLRRVKQSSEDKRWEARGGDDEMMRTIWVAEERRRAERIALDAITLAAPREEEDEELEYHASDRDWSVMSQREDESLLDEFAKNEAAELEALLAMEQSEEQQQQKYDMQSSEKQGSESHYGSDDDEFDNIFMDVVNDGIDSFPQQDVTVNSYKDEDASQDAMDIS